MLARRLIAVVLLAAYLPACMEYKPVDLGRPPTVPMGRPTLRVTLRGGRLLVLKQPQLVRDSLISGDGPTRVAVAVQDVMKTEVYRQNQGKSEGALVLGVLGVAVVALGVIAVASTPDFGCWCERVGRIP